VEDHDTRERLGGVLLCRVEGGVVNGGQDFGWVIANVFASAIIVALISLGDITDAVPEGTKSHRRVALGRLVGEGHLEDGNVIDDWCRDRRDEEKDGRGE